MFVLNLLLHVSGIPPPLKIKFLFYIENIKDKIFILNKI